MMLHSGHILYQRKNHCYVYNYVNNVYFHFLTVIRPADTFCWDLSLRWLNVGPEHLANVSLMFPWVHLYLG